MKTKTLIAAAMLGLALTATPAAAFEINFQTVLRDADGQPLKDDTGKETTLGRVAMISLGARYQEDAAAPMDEIYKRGALGIKVYEAKTPVDLNSEDIAMIKKYVAKLQSPLIVAKAFPLLEQTAGAKPPSGK